MEPKPYEDMTEADLLALCVWREARGEKLEAKRGVAHVVLNRVARPGWWGNSIHSVILKPYQFSSFSADDPNNTKWPEEGDPSFNDCQKACAAAMTTLGDDITDGATHYHDTSIDFPKGWGSPDEYEHTAALDTLKFYKLV